MSILKCSECGKKEIDLCKNCQYAKMDAAKSDIAEESNVMKNLYGIMVMTVAWGLVWADMPIPYWVAIILTVVGLVLCFAAKPQTAEDRVPLVANICLAICLILMGLKFSSPMAESFPGIVLVVVCVVCIAISLVVALGLKSKAAAENK